MMRVGRVSKSISCSFCAKGQEEVSRLVAGPSVYICNECIDLCIDIMEDENVSKEKVSSENIASPKDIKAHLDKHVIGQEEAKKILSVGVFNHFTRILHRQRSKGKHLDKSNILLVGPTGSGKTLIARTLAEFVGVPFTIADATSLTEAGYVGDDVESIISALLAAAGGDIEKAQRGIVMIDEIDKIARMGETNMTRDVSGEGVQQALLKMLEGSVVKVPVDGGRRGPMQPTVEVDTSDILFICGGAFSGLESIIAQRKEKKKIGFGTIVAGNVLPDLEVSDLVKYGMIPEFIGRLPIIATLKALTLDEMVSVLTKPKKNIIDQYKLIYEMSDMELVFEDEALKELASMAMKRGTGARGLRGILEKLLLDNMFNYLGNGQRCKVIITKEFVNGTNVLTPSAGVV